jgi:DNA-binding MurR/RpiR family transcriptional regulator
MPQGVLLGDQGGTLGDQIARVEADDVLVAVSQAPYARQTVECVRQAAAQQATVISITDSALSPTARRVRHVLLFAAGTSSFFRSTTGATALAEALVATVAAMGGARIQRQLQLTQEQLRRSNAYWERSSPSRPEPGPGAKPVHKQASDS